MTGSHADLINAAFEFVGSFFTWMNVRSYWLARRLQGVYWPSTAFFAVWGLWNLFYYPALGQWYSFAGGVILTGGSLVWLVLVVWDLLCARVEQKFSQAMAAEGDELSSPLGSMND